LVWDSEGNLYGTTFIGGTFGYGTVFRLSRGGKQTVFYSFTGLSDGSGPNGVIRDTRGNFYGTASLGGSGKCNSDRSGCGTVFKLSKAGKETTLYQFAGGADGANPAAGVIQDAEGNVYGTTPYGGDLSCDISGSVGCGVVFKLSASGNETILHTFTGEPDGAGPYAGLIWGGDHHQRWSKSFGNRIQA